MALLYAVLASFLAASMVTLMLSVSLLSDKAANLKHRSGAARYMAEGGVEAAKKEVQKAVARWDAVPTAGAVTVDGHEARYTVRPTGFTSTTIDPSGLETLVTGFEIEAESTVFGAHAQSFRVMNSIATPLFQFAVFYANDLEILPGPSMTLSGRVHSNRDLYLGSNNTLTMNTNYVRCVGNLYRNRKDDPSDSTGTVDIRKWVVNPWNPAEPIEYQTLYSRSELLGLGAASAGGYDSNFQDGLDANHDADFSDPGDILPFGPGALAFWSPPAGYMGGEGHTVLTAQHEVAESVVPGTESIAMFEPLTGGNFVFDAVTHQYVACAPGTGTHAKGYYHAHADLTILVAENGTSFKAYDAAGSDITASVAPAVALSSLYDARQANGVAGDTPIVDIDVQALAATGHFPANGLLYAAHYGAGTGTHAKGVRLKNGAVLPGKLTVVSEDPLYVQGDYNTGDASHPKVGAAVIADAVNLLSNAWDDTKSATSGLPTALETAYNVAIVSGNQDTSVGHYNGGLENLPRFHEDWSGITCAIKGSFVNLWHSVHATGAWVYGGNRYQAPSRRWAYDTAFNNVLNLPPFTPMAVSARDVVSW